MNLLGAAAPLLGAFAIPWLANAKWPPNDQGVGGGGGGVGWVEGMGWAVLTSLVSSFVVPFQIMWWHTPLGVLWLLKVFSDWQHEERTIKGIVTWFEMGQQMTKLKRSTDWWIIIICIAREPLLCWHIRKIHLVQSSSCLCNTQVLLVKHHHYRLIQYQLNSALHVSLRLPTHACAVSRGVATGE